MGGNLRGEGGHFVADAEYLNTRKYWYSPLGLEQFMDLVRRAVETRQRTQGDVELLIDAGAVVTPSVCEGLIRDRASGLLQLFERSGLLPRTLKFRAALGDRDAVRASLDEAMIWRPSMKRSDRLPLRARARCHGTGHARARRWRSGGVRPRVVA